ncbi:hypothetical protein JDV02_008067 [Purpureocillium takamizusanense]|uniref:AB hydrolase-1 domain-containing protein n=1 Tax=Purpureocillium takamizusanense TaxID=2060973 RepID=A0A9Q8QLY6_9HYPO|nr:uncharacterized protein JDV02_008067 [Purpureocillium takamizusanense]UNI22150.1 hypothetical protein JDV02_008067 [Purpureocillium takamizusanense]
MLTLLVSLALTVLDIALTLVATLATRAIDYVTRSTTHPRSSSSGQDTTLSACSYRLDSTSPLTVTLPGYRILSYAQFGSRSPTARTIFFLHGWPGSRIEATYLHEAAQANNVRIIAPDRPGIGQSTPDPNRTLLSHADDIDSLAQHLGADHYGVLGVSGGGPYALACARALPADKLRVVGIVCGLGPADIGYWGMYMTNYLGWTYASRYTPRFLGWWFNREPTARLDLSRRERMDRLIKGFDRSQASLPPKDARIFGDADVMKVQIRTGEEVNAQGGGTQSWLVQDMRLLASDPKFDVADIRKDLRVMLLYGEADRNVPCRHGEEIARRLRRRRGEADERVTLTVKEHETHASIFFDYRDEILRDMAAAM